MNLYLISQTKNDDWYTYDSAIVAAEDAYTARITHPNGHPWDGSFECFGTWAAAEDVMVRLVGQAVEGTAAGVICASFHAW